MLDKIVNSAAAATPNVHQKTYLYRGHFPGKLLHHPVTAVQNRKPIRQKKIGLSARIREFPKSDVLHRESLKIKMNMMVMNRDAYFNLVFGDD